MPTAVAIQCVVVDDPERALDLGARREGIGIDVAGHGIRYLICGARN